MLEKSGGGESDMGLALNRYIGNSIMPVLVKYKQFYADAENFSPLLEATLHTVYRLSKGKMLTNVQRNAVSDFIVTLTTEIAPVMLLKLLRQLTVDLMSLNEYSNVALRVSIFNIISTICKMDTKILGKLSGSAKKTSCRCISPQQ